MSKAYNTFVQSIRIYYSLYTSGVIRTMLQHTLNLKDPADPKFGKSRRRITLGNDLASIKYPSEFKRRARETLDIKQMKGAEFRNLALFAFHLVANLFPDGSEVKKLWILSGYILRINLLNDEEYINARSKNKIPLTEIYRRWMRTFQGVFGKKSMVHNVHMVGHWDIARKLGPFTETSLFREESSYGRLQKRFHAGTTNIGKQAMQKFVYCEMALGHRDSKTPKFNTKDLSKTDDSVMYLQNGDFVKLTRTKTDEEDNCKYFVKRFKTEAYRPPECPDLTFTYIQVRKLVCLADDEEELDISNPQQRVLAKGVLAGTLLLAVPNGILMEEL